MLLYLIGIDLTTLLVINALLIGVGIPIFRLSKRILQKLLSQASGRTINIVSGIFAFVLSPAIVFGSFALIIYSVS
jgi:hypothetical protein